LLGRARTCVNAAKIFVCCESKEWIREKKAKRTGTATEATIPWGGAVCTQLTGEVLHACNLVQLDKAGATR
jgi:hypothetical protein